MVYIFMLHVPFVRKPLETACVTEIGPYAGFACDAFRLRLLILPLILRSLGFRAFFENQKHPYEDYAAEAGLIWGSMLPFKCWHGRTLILN